MCLQMTRHPNSKNRFYCVARYARCFHPSPGLAKHLRLQNRPWLCTDCTSQQPCSCTGFSKTSRTTLILNFGRSTTKQTAKGPDGNVQSSSFIRCPERSFQIAPHEQSDSIVHLFQVRDPRDILVSEYYSLGWRHSDQHWSDEEKERRNKIQQMTVDQYVLDEPEISTYPLLGRFQALLHQPQSANRQIVKYETMVTRFDNWLREVLPVFRLTNEKVTQYFARKYKDEFSREDSATSHKRNVVPGDHRLKLKSSTIDALNHRFESVLDFLGYPASVAFK